MSGWGSLRQGSAQSGNCPVGEVSVGEMFVGEVSVGELSSWETVLQSFMMALWSCFDIKGDLLAWMYFFFIETRRLNILKTVPLYILKLSMLEVAVTISYLNLALSKFLSCRTVFRLELSLTDDSPRTDPRLTLPLVVSL